MVPQLAMDQMPSLTYDRGKEMAWYMEFTERTGIKAYFAEWQYLISNFNYEECYE
jgi:IS30 family transposase